MEIERATCEPRRDDWISAIRVRVGGIDELDARAQAQIERVAQEIAGQTGLHVDIMVGSSPQPVLVHLPGYGEAPGRGYVEEQWVKKNVNTLVQTGMNRADRLLFGGMLAACLLFRFNANYLAVLGRVGEFGLLRAIGWRPRTISALLLGEALFLGLASGLLGAALSLAASGLLRLEAPPERVLLLVPLGGLAFLAGALLPAWQAGRTALVTALRAAETSPRRRLPAGSFLGYALDSLTRRPARSLASFAGLCLGSGMLALLKLAVDELQGELYGSLLGTWIRTQLQPYHFLMGAIALLVSAGGAALVMLLNLRERRSEIGLLRAVGWRQGDVFRLVLLESGLLSLGAGILGTALAAGLMWLSTDAAFDLLPTLPQTLWLSTGLPLLATLLAALYPAARAARLLPLDALRGVERLVSARPIRAHTLRAVAALGLLALLGMGAGQVWQARPTPEPPQAAGVVLPTATGTPTLPPPVPWREPDPVDPDMLPEYYLQIEIGKNRLYGWGNVTFTNQTGEPLKTVVLRLYPNLAGASAGADPTLRLSSLSITGGVESLDYAGEGSVAVVDLTRPVAPGRQVRIDLSFELDLPPLDDSGTQVWRLHSFFPMLAVYENGAWRTDVCAFCGDVVYSQSANFELRVITPPGWTVASGGDYRAIPLGEESVTHIFETQSGPLRDLALALSPGLRSESRMVGDTRISLFLPDSAEAGPGEAILSAAVQAFETYTRRFGPYPYPALNIVAVPSVGAAGAEFPGLIYLSYKEDDPDLEKVTAHEVAHQWWYGLVGNDIFHEAWLDESLAEYSALLFLEEQGFQAEIRSFLDESDRQVNQLEVLSGHLWKVGSSVYDFPDFSTYYEVVYAKGPLFLQALRDAIGSEAFFAGLRQYLEWYRFGVGRGQGFLEAMQRASGQDLRPLFEEWVGLDNLR